MTYPYLLISDTHHHNWDAFATVNERGVNSRNQIIIDETRRAFEELRKAGGRVAFHAGDMFHVRGSIPPSVLIPVQELYRELSKEFSIFIIPGNHDLEGKNVSFYGSSSSAVEFAGASVYTGDDVRLFMALDIAICGWEGSIPKLKEKLEMVEPSQRRKRDLIIHAPIDGVIPGIPDHGLTADYLAGLGYKRVFAGHYHNHKDFGNGVYSIGALTHQTWSDVGSRAGFLLVYEDRVEYRASHAPRFEDLSDVTSMEEYICLVEGNYVRARLVDPTNSEVENLRKELYEMGAKGVLIQSISTTKTEGRREIIDKMEPLEVSITKFADTKGKAGLAAECLDILRTVRGAK